MSTPSGSSSDALPPQEMAVKAEAVGIRKAQGTFVNLFLLGILAGVYVALGGLFATTVSAGASGILPYGLTRLLMGVVFSLGLILVIVGGAELFTGNTLIAIAWASGKVSTGGLLRNWAIVYLGNFVGSVLIALLVLWGKHYTAGGGSMGLAMLSIANAKLHLGFWQAIALGVLCNLLVCLAVWLTYGARSVSDKILAIIFPIAAFVAAGFEHSVANMYFIPLGLFLKEIDPAFVSNTAAQAGLDLTGMTWGNFLLKNLLPVTIGNIIGGAVMVGLIYWVVYLYKRQSS